MDKSPLNKLPRELRDTINESAMSHVDPIVVDLHSGHPHLVHPPKSQNVLASTRVCKQMREECAPLFYSGNRFILVAKRKFIEETPWQRALCRWLASISYQQHLHLSQVVIDIGTTLTLGSRPIDGMLRIVSDALSLFDVGRTRLSLRIGVIVGGGLSTNLDLGFVLPLTDTNAAMDSIDEAIRIQGMRVERWAEIMGSELYVRSVKEDLRKYG